MKFSLVLRTPFILLLFLSAAASAQVGSPPPPQLPAGSYALFSSTALPAVADANAYSPLELGMKFTADVDGQITGVRFYKSTSNTGTHVGSLWSNTGQLLASVTFTNETASGWQQANFSAPVSITPNTVYVISYHSSGHYSFDWGYFQTPIDNPPLHAVSGSSGNGVYGYSSSSAFPTLTAPGTNYWVDLVFSGSSSNWASLVSIGITPSNASVAAGFQQQFQATGTYTDGSTQDITAKASWSSGTPSVVAINTSGGAQGISTGSSVITATLGNVSGTTALTVTGAPSPPPLVSASPPSIDFGSVVVGTSANQSMTLSNTGNSSVTVTSATTTGSGFSLSGVTFPFTLAAAASQTATLTFAPSSSGAASGNVSFVSNATNSPATVALSGSGTAAQAHLVTLSWQPSTSTVSGYNVYRGGTSGGPYARLNSVLEASNNFVDSTVQSGNTYYYVVTSVDTTGLESGYSNQVAAIIPTP